MIIWRLSALDLVARNILDTAPQFCGLKTYERYSRQMVLQTNCAAFEGRREPRRRVRRMSKPSSRDRRSRGSRLVRLFGPQNCGAVAHAIAETGRVEDDRKLSRFHNGFYLQGDRSTTYAERAPDCKLARLRAPCHQRAAVDRREGLLQQPPCGRNFSCGFRSRY